MLLFNNIKVLDRGYYKKTFFLKCYILSFLNFREIVIKEW